MHTNGTTATFVATLLVTSLVASVAVVGALAGGVAADQHTKPEAQDVTEEADFTVRFPYTTNHYPGDQNAENGTIQYFFSPAESFAELGIEEGAYGHFVIIEADWIDYSACSVDNTVSFGIDRGNNNSGTQTDVDLVSRRKDDDFRDDGLTVEFYTQDDFGGDPPYMAPEDAIVAEQGAGSNDGPCLTVTSDPGWYQIQGFLNGTEADNGPDEDPSEDAKRVGGIARSNYLYVCECEDGQEAREQLGPPPNESGGESTPTPTVSGDDPTPTDAGSDPTPTDAGPETEPTPTLETQPETSPTPTAAGPGNDDGGDGGNTTPTLGEGPGFTGLAALVAMLAGALLVRRD